MPTTKKNPRNRKQYEALKDEGMSKERAAKIANTPGASKRGGKKKKATKAGGAKKAGRKKASRKKKGGSTAQKKAAGRKGGKRS